jgi:hypothetical protein
VHELTDSSDNMSNVESGDCEVLKRPNKRSMERYIIKVKTSVKEMLSNFPDTA